MMGIVIFSKIQPRPPILLSSHPNCARIAAKKTLHKTDLPMMPDFLFVTCQIGAETAVKGELARRWPKFRLAFSRPGFLTFKLPPDHGLAEEFDLESVFARAYGFSLGKVVFKNPDDKLAGVWELCKGHAIQRIHVWEKDRAEPGEHGYEPSISKAALGIHEQLFQGCPFAERLAKYAGDMLQPAKPGELILDCVVLSPDQWWVGFHRAKSVPSRYPGGMMSLELPPDAVSRAWLKMEEALRWSRLPIPPGARVAEIGSAPGGSSQALLARGMIVTGIDPAEMSPILLNHPRFTHLRRRSTQVRRREFQKIRWLAVDMNVAPEYTLEAVEAIVTHPRINVRGLLLTLKLPQWELAADVPEYLERIRSWGYNLVKARQLQYNRHEVCVAALQQPFRRKPSARR
jgi:23S rRNA (cytidine2498-2'-O)-methyltransferase